MKILGNCWKKHRGLWSCTHELVLRNRFGDIVWQEKVFNTIAAEGEANVGDVYLLGTALVSFYLGMCNQVLTKASIITDLTTEPSGYGYARKEIERSAVGWPIKALDPPSTGDWKYTSKPVTFTASGGSIGPISMMFLTDSLPAELITNGDAELDSNWASYGTPATNERSGTQYHGGTYSRHFVPNAVNEGIQGDAFATVTGRDYLLDLWVHPDDGTTATIKVRKGDNSGWSLDEAVTGLTQDAWNHIQRTVSETAGGAGAYVVVESGAGTTGNWYVDDVSVKLVGKFIAWAALSGTRTILDTESLSDKMSIKFQLPT